MVPKGQSCRRTAQARQAQRPLRQPPVPWNPPENRERTLFSFCSKSQAGFRPGWSGRARRAIGESRPGFRPGLASLARGPSGLRIVWLSASSLAKLAAPEAECLDGGLRDRAECLHLLVRGCERGDDLLGLCGIFLRHVAERVLRLAAAERLGDDQHGLPMCHEWNMAPIVT